MELECTLRHTAMTPHSKRLWGYPYVEYPIANTYEAEPMADSHSYQTRAVHGVGVHLTAHSYEAPHSKKLVEISLRRVPHSKHL